MNSDYWTTRTTICLIVGVIRCTPTLYSILPHSSRGHIPLVQPVPYLPGNQRKVTLKIVHKPIFPAGILQGEADLVDLQLSPDDGYKSILNYQYCFRKIVLRPLRSRQQIGWRDSWCRTSMSTVPGYPAHE